MDALQQLSDALADAAKALAVLPISETPEVRAALVDLVEQAQAVVEELTTLVRIR